MAVYISETKEMAGNASITERIEVLPWRLGGKQHQEFVIGPGTNFGANSNILVEIIYWINDVPLFYTRSFIHYYVRGELPAATLDQAFASFKSGTTDTFGVVDMLPETGVILRRDPHSRYHLQIAVDIGSGISRTDMGTHMINIEIDLAESDALAFMEQLLQEIVDVHGGKHPNPAQRPAGSSYWSFARQVNQQAYDRVAAEYQEKYFDEALLSSQFDAWLDRIPGGGHILDVGCGHGQPVIARLLEKGYRATGADLSPKMLERARQSFPEVCFVNQMASELTFESEFDGACSLSSLLYLDPIDLSHSLYRLHRALKKDGLLFLYAYDLDPTWRGAPYHLDLGEWMWGWTYGMDEVIAALEEHGYFEVLTAVDVTPQQERDERLEAWYTEAREHYEKYLEKNPALKLPKPDRSQPPPLMYKYIVIARVRKDQIVVQ